MAEPAQTNAASQAEPIPFKAETRQLLDILIHSLYTEREIFLRELISNASDALTRMNFEMLTNRDVLDPEAELAIYIHADPENRTLTIRDTGVGMTADELVANLGTIAHSGARQFLAALKEGERNLSDLIGQFGVGFYSAFMAAEWIRVVSRSFQPGSQAASWFCTGADTYIVEPAEKLDRGTAVIIQLKEDAKEFAQEYRLKEIIRRHSDFIPFPIYLGEKKEQVNRQTALWRQSPREVEKKDYEEFYRQMTLDFDPPLTYTHLSFDAPVQLYAVLFVPSSPERTLVSLRRESGLKLYARKVLIQEYHRDLLPEYFEFIQGVVDSEDLPLNVSREAIQSTRVMAQLKKLLTGKVIDMLKKLAADEPEAYTRFWESYGRYIKQGVATELVEPEALYPLLRFRTTYSPETWTTLDDIVQRLKPGQEQIYYLMGDDRKSLLFSPHLDVLRKLDYEALLLTDPMDAFMMIRLNKYNEHPLVNAAAANLQLPVESVEKAPETPPAETYTELLGRFKANLGDKVEDVRLSERLSDSPARLVDAEGGLNQEMQRVYKLLNKEFNAPKKILELNPRHPILTRLIALPVDHPLQAVVIEQIYEDALLIEGLHPDPAAMIGRIQKLMETALE